MDSVLNNSMICGACRTELLLGEEYVQCMVVGCGKVYHYACNGKSLSTEAKAVWACPECVCAVRKGGSNSETPVGTPLNVKNVTLRKPSGPPVRPSETEEAGKSPLATLECKLLREQISFLSEQLADALSTMDRYNSALTTCTDKLQEVSERLIDLEHSMRHRDLSAEDKLPQTPCDEAVKLQKHKKGLETKRRRTKGVALEEKKAVAIRPEVFPHGGGDILDISPISVTLQEEKAIKGQLSGSFDAKTSERDGCTEGGFELVQSKKHRRSTSMRGTAGPNVTSLRAVEDRKYIHLWNMASTADEVLLYLKSLDLGGSCTVEELKAKGNYKSYKIGVPAASFDKCMSADLWPDNARIKMWLFRRQTTKHQSVPS